MKDNRNTFPKLETGMVVCVKGQIEFGLGPYLVVGNKMLSADGWNILSAWREDGIFERDSDFDIVGVFNSESVFSLSIAEHLNYADLIWQLKEQCPTQAKIAELEETIKKASQQIRQLKEEMND